jgi:Raf kinase inhibitor-like YbhB/YbcL family protein
MTNVFTVSIDAWKHGNPIPEKYAFGKQDAQTHVALTDNINPAISWSSVPVGTKSFAIICHDPDVPSSGDDVNQEGKAVPADLPRINFYHWVLAKIPHPISKIEESAASNGVTVRGKDAGGKTYGLAGINSYTDWFAGDADMEGKYADYDGPCPPWNDSIMHHYYFTVYALDVTSLTLEEEFRAPELLEKMQGHILAQAAHMGTYTLNPEL